MRTFSNFATNRFCSTRSIERLERVSSFAINDLQRHDRNGDQSFFALLPFLALRNTSPIVMPRMTIPRCCHRDMSGPALKEMRSAPTASPQCGCGTWRIAFTNRADQWAHAHYLMIGSNSVQNVHHSGTAYSRCGRSALEMLGWNRGNCEGRHPRAGWRQAVAIEPEAGMHGRLHVIGPAKTLRIEPAEGRAVRLDLGDFSLNASGSLPLHISKSAGGPRQQKAGNMPSTAWSEGAGVLQTNYPSAAARHSAFAIAIRGMPHLESAFATRRSAL